MTLILECREVEHSRKVRKEIPTGNYVPTLESALSFSSNPYLPVVYETQVWTETVCTPSCPPDPTPMASPGPVLLILLGLVALAMIRRMS